MAKYEKILRFRFDNEIADILSGIRHCSAYVRTAVREKLEKDGIIKNELPF